MSEEEVSQQLAQMNQDIYNKKLLKDIDLNFENLIHIFEDSIAIFQKQIDTRIYEVIFDRKEAIYKGINIMDSGDILLILGKLEKVYKKIIWSLLNIFEFAQ